jgi:putative aminopeptidase FrvX
MKSLIQKLVEIGSPSGFESPIREAVRLEIAPLADEMSVDPMGNLIARMGPTTGYTIMLAAHVDEIGLMVTHVDENGFARFVPIGGVSSRTCIGGRVRFLNGAAGVIGVERQAMAANCQPLTNCISTWVSILARTARYEPATWRLLIGRSLTWGNGWSRRPWMIASVPPSWWKPCAGSSR